MSGEGRSIPVVPVAVLLAILMAARMLAGNGIAATAGVRSSPDPRDHRQHFWKTPRLRQQQQQRLGLHRARCNAQETFLRSDPMQVALRNADGCRCHELGGVRIKETMVQGAVPGMRGHEVLGRPILGAIAA